MTATDDQLIANGLARLADHAPEFSLDALDIGAIDRVRNKRHPVPFAVAAAVLTLAGGTTYLLGEFRSSSGHAVPAATSKPTQPTTDVTIEEDDGSQSAQLAAGKILEAEPEFGGAWFDDAGVFHVLLKNGYDRARLQAAEDKLVDPRDMVVDEATYSMRELEAQHAGFERLVPAMERAGINVGEAGIDVARNRVYAHIHSDVDQARRYVQGHLDDAPALELQAGTGSDHMTTWSGNAS